MGWRDLRNAPLIEAFGRYSASPGAGLPPGDITTDTLLAKGVADRLVEDALLDEYQEVIKHFGVNGWRIGTICALMVWEDMHEIVASDIDHLNRMIQMFPNTELAFRCEAAIRFHTFVPEGVGKQACAESKERPRRFA